MAGRGGGGGGGCGGLGGRRGAARCSCAPGGGGRARPRGRRAGRGFGDRVEVWWDAERRYYAGAVTAVDAARGTAAVAYDDGDADAAVAIAALMRQRYR